MRVLRNCGISLAVGALVIASAITAEAVTDPTDVDRAPHYVAGLAAPVALVLFGGMLLLLIGMAGLFARLAQAGGRGCAAVVAIAVGLAVAEIPHTILDMSAIPATYKALPAAQATDLVNNHFDTWPGALSGIGILPLLIGSIVLAVRMWRGGALPAWSARFAVVMLVLAIVELPLSSAAWWLPHGPVLLYVGIAGYGLALAGSRRTPVEHVDRELVPVASSRPQGPA